jgi:N-acetylneuraminate synthase
MPTDKSLKSAYISVLGQQALKNNVILLHCTSQYPAPIEDVNLNAIETMRTAFNLPVGYSDHTNGISIPTGAVALGARCIEKHFTLDQNLPGPDHKASLEPVEFKAMVTAIREVEAALGNGIKSTMPSELENIGVARKCLVASTDIESGDLYTEDNLTAKRSKKIGISPMEYWSLLGKKSNKNHIEDEVIV